MYQVKILKTFKNNILKYIFFILFLFLIINYFILYKSKCSLNSFIKTSLDFSLEHSFNSCKILYKNYTINLTKSFLSDTFLEVPLRKIREKKYGKKYSYLNTSLINDNNFDQIDTKIKKHTSIDPKKIKNYLKEENLKKIHKNKEWFTSGGDYQNTRFNTTEENINLDNIKNLKLLWKYESFDAIKNPKKWRQNIAINPLFVDDKIIFVSADYKIVALNVINGELIWSKKFLLEPSKRGMTTHREGENTFLYLTIGNSLVKINIKNGKLEKSFGKKGIVNNVKTLTAPVIDENEIILTGFNDIKLYDTKTGRSKGNIKIHPKDKDFKQGGVIWGGNAFDKKNKIMFVPTGNPRPALIGLDRVGENNNANSLVAIDLNKKKIKWSFQDVIHDLWDFDVSSPPILADLKFGNEFLEAVIITTKTGNTHVLDRMTGHSLFQINYKKAPKSKIFNEKTSKFQLNQSLPEKLSNVDFHPNDLNDEARNNYKIIMEMERSTYGWFEPPAYGKKLILNGIHGGATWTGSALNPEKNILYTPINNYPFYLLVEGKTFSQIKPNHDYFNIYQKKCSSCHGKYRNGTIDANSKKDIEMIEKIEIINKSISRGYMPSLIGHSLFEKNNIDDIFSSQKFNFYHKNLLSNKDKKSMKVLFEYWDQLLLKNEAIHLRYHWAKFTDNNGLPPTKGPWGKIVSMDIKSGRILWEKNFGKKNDNETDNEMSGTINYGGVALNGNNILFATGTPDNYVYALNAKNGNVLWSYQMKAAGSTSPIIYQVNGKQYLSILSTGGYFKEFKQRASVLYTFSINEP